MPQALAQSPGRLRFEHAKLYTGVPVEPPSLLWQTRRDACPRTVDMQPYRQWLQANLGMTMQSAMGESTYNICKA